VITVVRGAEPSELEASRAKKLKEAVALFNKYGPASKELLDCLDGGYQVARDTLWGRQHKKCAYCEQQTPLEEQPTEHFRPKKHALRNWRAEDPDDKDVDRYWWLTWTWENLLFACTTCNGRSHKGNHFPLVRSSEPLAAARVCARGWPRAG
jgi:hypothetical protein